MPLVEITSQTSVKGVAARVGDIVNVTEEDARTLKNAGFAKDAEKGSKAYSQGKPDAPKPAAKGKAAQTDA